MLKSLQTDGNISGEAGDRDNLINVGILPHEAADSPHDLIKI